MSDTLTIFAEQLSLALQPLDAAFDSPGAVRDFLEDLGWDFDVAPAAIDSLRAPVEAVFDLASNPDGIDPADVAQIINGVRGALQAVSNLRSAAGLAADFKNEFPRQLVDYLVVDYLLNNQPRVGYLLMALGIVTLEERPAAAPRSPYFFRGFAWEKLSDLLHDPLSYLKNVYQWGESNFAFDRLTEGLYGALDAWGLRVRDGLLDAQTVSILNNGALQPEQTNDGVLRFIIIENTMDPEQLSAGVGLFPLAETASAKPGFALLPFATAGFEEEFQISDELSLSFRGNLDLTGGAGILVRPNRDVEFMLGFASGAPTPATGGLGIVLRLTSAGTPFTLIGDPDASRFELVGVSTTAGTRLSSSGKLDVFAEFALEKGKIVIKPGAGMLDGFLATLFPANGLQLETSLTVGASSEQGIYFSGSGGLEISIPTHIQLGPIEIQSALIAVKPADGAIPVELAATIKGDLGILKAVVENVGIKTVFTFPPNRDGNLGPVNLDLAFRPPNGIGLSVDAGIVTGGGYLYFDPDRGEYAGALELTFSGFLALKAIGLLNTKMPDGSSGFSLLIIITAEFGTGHSAWVWLHASCRRWITWIESHRSSRPADGRCAHGRGQQHHVPEGRDRKRAADHQRSAHDLSTGERQVSHRPDGKTRLGHADAYQPFVRHHHRSPGQHRHPRRLARRAADGRRGAHCFASELRGRDRVRQSASLFLCRDVRIARALLEHRRRDGCARRVR